MKIGDIRRENARALASQERTQAAFGAKIGMDGSQTSQIIGKRPVRKIGDEIARRIEMAYLLPEGWMDVPHSTPLVDPQDIAIPVIRESKIEDLQKQLRETAEKLMALANERPELPSNLKESEQEYVRKYQELTDESQFKLLWLMESLEKRPDAIKEKEKEKEKEKRYK